MLRVMSLIIPAVFVALIGTSIPVRDADANAAEKCIRLIRQGNIETLKQLEVKRVLLKPFKVKTILETITAFVQAPPAPHKHP